MRIGFGTDRYGYTYVNDEMIMSLSQKVQPYEQYFSIGNTVCRQFTLEVDKNAFSNPYLPFPVYVRIFDDDDSDYATLVVDSYDDQNENYTIFNLTDVMVRFNKQLTYSIGETIYDILERICEEHDVDFMSTRSQIYMSDFPITWQDDILERDLISYVAEVNGGYAFIDGSGGLAFEKYKKSTADEIYEVDCSDIKVGSPHVFDRVYLELGTATQYYPDTSAHETIYLNPENILLTGNSTYTTKKILKHIYSVIKNFTYYPVEIGQCPITSARACQLIGLRIGTDNDLLVLRNGDYVVTEDDDNIRVQSNVIPFLCTVDYEYNNGWYGGYTCDIEAGLQEETESSSSVDNRIRRVSIKVDRERGEITQQISSTADNIRTEVTQNTSSIEASVSKINNFFENDINGDDGINARLTNLETRVAIDIDGVKVSQGRDGAYTMFKDDGMEVYVNSEQVAWAKADGFSSKELMIGDANATQKWHMHMANNGYTLMFLRREDNNT